MQNPNDLPGLDDLVDAIAARLAGRFQFRPTGEAPPGLPPGFVPLPQLDDSFRDVRIGGSIGIDSIELTQSIQHHGTAYGTDNSVQLVAYKTMVARVYPFVKRSTLGTDSLTGQRVTGELTLSIGNRVIYQTGPTRSDGARLGPTSQLDRGSWDREQTLLGGGSRGLDGPIALNCPLNFLVPAYYCKSGRVHLTIRLWPVTEGPTSSRSATSTRYVEFLNVQAPKICLVRVNWVDGNGNVTRPSDEAMLDTLRTATRMLPFPYFQTTILTSEITSNLPFAMVATAGACNPSWNSLLIDLNLIRIFTTLFQLGDIVFGMVPQAAIPAGSTQINSGCGGSSGGGFIGLESTFAHEIGHLYGRKHVAVNGDPDNDANYPNYGGSRRLIGEVGIDTGTTPPTLFEPSNTDDLMSYPLTGNNQWISPYTYQNILDARDTHQSEPVDPKRLRPLLILDFRVFRAVQGQSRVEIRKTIRVDAPGRTTPLREGATSPLSLDLIDHSGRILATHHCTWASAHGNNCGCGCGGVRVPLDREPWLDFQEVIELPAEGLASIDFHRGEGAFHTIVVGNEPPSVLVEGPENREGRLVLRVRTEHPREQVSVVVLFSADNGTTWQPVAFDPPRNRVVIESDTLSGGERCLFRVIGTAELQSTTVDTEVFELSLTPRRMFLDIPADGCRIDPGPVALSAMVETRGLGAIAPTDIRWTSNLDGDLGYGYALTPDLRPGHHELTVTAPNGLGGMLTERAIIIVSGRPR